MHFHREKPATKPMDRKAEPKPKLDMLQLPIFRVHYRKLEYYLCRVFHWDDFNFLMATGTQPDQIPEYIVSTSLPPANDIHRRMDAIRNGRRTHDVSLILTVLCQDGYIPAGKYLVDTHPETPPLECYKSLLRKTGTPESEACRAFRTAHRHDKHFSQLAAVIDAQVLDVLRQLSEE